MKKDNYRKKSRKDTPEEYGRWGGEMGIRLIDDVEVPALENGKTDGGMIEDIPRPIMIKKEAIKLWNKYMQEKEAKEKSKKQK